MSEVDLTYQISLKLLKQPLLDFRVVLFNIVKNDHSYLLVKFFISVKNLKAISFETGSTTLKSLSA